MEEQWKDIEQYEDYMISSFGNVFSKKAKKIIKPRINNSGYGRVSLTNENGKKEFLVHRLVALEFIPNPDNKQCVDHINADKLDNRVENLRWATIKENNNNPNNINKNGHTQKFWDTHLNYNKNHREIINGHTQEFWDTHPNYISPEDKKLINGHTQKFWDTHPNYYDYKKGN